MSLEVKRQSENKDQAWEMFDRIAKRYDMTNRLLSMRQDVSWRKKVAQYLPNKSQIKFLDLATGTADQIIFTLAQTDKIQKAIGVDMSENMLAIGRKKINDLALSNLASLKVGDATNLMFKDNEFDAVTISFGIRNVNNLQAALKEMYRVLNHGGRAIILEFSLPQSKLIKAPYLFYFRHILPHIGSQISGDTHAYKYLNNTVEDFPYGHEFEKQMEAVGFQNVSSHPLTFGIATIYVGEKLIQ